MNERIKELAEHAGYTPLPGFDLANELQEVFLKKFADFLHAYDQRFAELIVGECIEQVEQAKNSPFVSLDDAKRMSHFVDVTKKRIEKHFRS